MFVLLEDQLFLQVYLRILWQKESISKKNNSSYNLSYLTKKVTLSDRAICSVGHNTNLSSNRNMSKTVGVNSIFTSLF